MRDSINRHIVDYQSITERQRETWAAGDFHEIARQIVPVSEDLCRTVNPRSGQRVLDVACGSGNTALVAARRYCDVAGIDYVPALIERAKTRAKAEGVNIDFRVGDAQSIPYPDASMDIVMSVFGVMFAPDQKKAANELLRVCKPGGKIGLACWIPEGFGVDFFGTHAKYVPPPPGIDSPLLWGTEDAVQELLGNGVSSIVTDRCTTRSYFRSIEQMIDVFSTYFGPTRKTRQSLNSDDKSVNNFFQDLGSVFMKHNIATDDTVEVKGEYLRIIATRA